MPGTKKFLTKISAFHSKLNSVTLHNIQVLVQYLNSSITYPGYIFYFISESIHSTKGNDFIESLISNVN